MSTVFLDCSMGAAGDMLSAALLELCPDRDAALARLNAVGIPGVSYRAERAEKCGIAGTRLRVTYEGAEEGGVEQPRHSRGMRLGDIARDAAKSASPNATGRILSPCRCASAVSSASRDNTGAKTDGVSDSEGIKNLHTKMPKPHTREFS